MSPHLHLVDSHTGEATEVCHACMAKDKMLASQARKITLLENAEQERLGLAPDAPQIMEVLQYHKRMLTPRGGRIVRGGPAWKNVKARLMDVDAETEELAFSVLHLKAAVVGLWLSDWHRAHRKVGAAWLFSDPDRVQEFLAPVIAFKRDTGTSALYIIDVLGRPGLEKWAEECDCCGHLRLEHERENPTEELWDPPCAVHGCACPGWSDSLEWRIARWQAERSRERMGA